MGKINSKSKGNTYELKVAKQFEELGFPKVTTSRFTSKEKDDAKVDLCGTEPFNVQCKAVEKTMCLHSVLESMPTDRNINVVFHKKNRRSPIVAMHEKDFLSLVKILIDEGLLEGSIPSEF